MCLPMNLVSRVQFVDIKYIALVTNRKSIILVSKVIYYFYLVNIPSSMSDTSKHSFSNQIYKIVRCFSSYSKITSINSYNHT